MNDERSERIAIESAAVGVRVNGRSFSRHGEIN